MLKWLATRFENRRADLQSRLERSVQPAAGGIAPLDSRDWRKQGNAHLSAGNLQEAANCYRRGLESDPQDSICFSNLGYVLGELGRAAESQEMLQRAVELDPSDFDAHYMLGNLARTRGEWLQAIGRYRDALKTKPDFDVCRRELCVSLAQMGHLGEARAVLAEGPAFAPDTADFHYFRGTLHLAAEEFDEALAEFRQAAQLQPRDASILINLGVAQLKKRDVFSAIETYRGIIEFDPANVQAHANLAAAYQQSSQLDLAIQTYRHLLRLNPEYLYAHQSLLFALTYLADFPPAEYVAEARRYGAVVSSRAKPFSAWLCPDAAAVPRPLRVGFVSGDLRTHPVGLFLESILTNIDAAKLALVAYSTTVSEDALSGRLKRVFAEWHSVAAMPDEALARKIHAGRIDILVDLAGHTGLNRLPVFAWRPAPVQVSWLGYWASTGVAEIDYILVDPVSVPKADAEFFSEELWYLPDTRLCMSAPVTSRPLDVQGLPAIRKGFVTFGSYQILNKISDRTLTAWAAVLARIPSARLRLQSLPLDYPDALANIRKRIAAAGIDIAKVDLHGGATREDYLASYADVDVILDTFPFPGGTTTAEALWMGVPTVTVSGNSLLARQGECLMRCVGLGDWVAHSEQGYVEVAVAHADNLEALAELRAGLRARAAASALFDANRFARNLENAFEAMARAKGIEAEILQS
jgi:protein O-GlcNAc transferase